MESIDITVRIYPETYVALGVSELWRREGDRIRVYHLQLAQYVEVDDSPTFPGLLLHQVIPDYLAQSQKNGRNETMRGFRQWVRERLRG